MYDRSLIYLVAGLYFFVGFEDVAEANLLESSRDSIKQPIRSIDTLPQNIRNGVAAALSARGRDTSLLTTNTTPDTAPIIGGRDAPDYKYPWFARMIYFWYGTSRWTWCGASVYNKRTIITAAHCVDHDPEQVDGFFAVHTGQYAFLEEEGLEQITLVDKIIMECMPILFKNYPQLDLNQTGNAIKHYGSMLNTALHPIWSARDGIKLLTVFLHIFISTSIWDNIETGDSGGPVGCYDDKGVYYQVGIVSWGIVKDGRCAGHTTVYTRISKYLRWIKFLSNKM